MLYPFNYRGVCVYSFAGTGVLLHLFTQGGAESFHTIRRNFFCRHKLSILLKKLRNFPVFVKKLLNNKITVKIASLKICYQKSFFLKEKNRKGLPEPLSVKGIRAEFYEFVNCISRWLTDKR